MKWLITPADSNTTRKNTTPTNIPIVIAMTELLDEVMSSSSSSIITVAGPTTRTLELLSSLLVSLIVNTSACSIVLSSVMERLKQLSESPPGVKLSTLFTTR